MILRNLLWIVHATPSMVYSFLKITLYHIHLYFQPEAPVLQRCFYRSASTDLSYSFLNYHALKKDTIDRSFLFFSKLSCIKKRYPGVYIFYKNHLHHSIFFLYLFVPWFLQSASPIHSIFLIVQILSIRIECLRILYKSISTLKLILQHWYWPQESFKWVMKFQTFVVSNCWGNLSDMIQTFDNTWCHVSDMYTKIIFTTSTQPPLPRKKHIKSIKKKTVHRLDGGLVGHSLPVLGDPWKVLYTTKTWLAVFLLSTDTGGDNLTATGGRWRRRFQEGNQAWDFAYIY